jgi:CubicO group peptidase (beta-lactamase class C family)
MLAVGTRYQKLDWSVANGTEKRCLLKWLAAASLIAEMVTGFAVEPSSPKSLSEGIDGLIAAQTQKDLPGGAVVVLRDGKVAYSKAYGLANIDSGVANTTSTKFQIASVTKSFTALAVLRLVEQGRLSLDDPLAKFVPDFVGGDRITIHHLLAHTGGLPDFMGFNEAKNMPRECAPGDRLNYSNIGYVALGRVIEKVTGKTYEAYLREAVLDPLAMHDTGVAGHQPTNNNWAVGYVFGSDGKFLKAQITDQSSDPGAGGLYSTAEDMTRWLTALSQGRLATPALLERATTAVQLNDGRKGSYGYGFMLVPFRGLREIAHGGDISGFNSYFALYPTEHLAVLVLCNAGMHPSGPVPTAAETAHRIIALALGDRLGPEWPAAKVLPTSVLDRYAGHYRLEAPAPVIEAMGDRVDFSRENAGLFASGKRGRLEIFAETDTTFYSKGGPIPMTITFVRKSDGSVSEAVLSMMGLREFRLHRLP